MTEEQKLIKGGKTQKLEKAKTKSLPKEETKK